MQIVSSGVDWVTLTSTEHNALSADELAHLRASILRTVYGGQAGVEIKPWSWQGYVGRQMGSFAYGHRPDGWIVRASSDMARVVAAALPWLNWKPTRVDVQVTARVEGSVDSVIARCRANVLVSRETLPAGRAAKIRYVVGHGQGDSVLIGSRRSQVYVRIYNKEAESGNDEAYKGCVRYEIEFKGGAAVEAWRLLVDARDQSREAMEMVIAKMRHYGAEPFEGYTVRKGYNVVSAVRPTDLETQLLWLERSVRPLVKKLIDKGYGSDVYYALGIASADEDETSTLVQSGMF